MNQHQMQILGMNGEINNLKRENALLRSQLENRTVYERYLGITLQGYLIKGDAPDEAVRKAFETTDLVLTVLENVANDNNKTEPQTT